MSSLIVLRKLQIGDIGWVAHRQGILYAQEYGWDGTFEALVAEIAAQFVKNFDPAWESAWIAERDSQVLGSVFLVKVSEQEAKLRLLYVEPDARGEGLGRRLTQECIAFAKARGYDKLTLWTNDILHAARRIYQEAGFVLVSEEQHHSFGHDLVGQYWALDLQGQALGHHPISSQCA
jgi:GNAT superfamily N-acetyltransferase